jgi:hypothetical protein
VPVLLFEAHQVAAHDAHACEALFRRRGESVEIAHLAAAASDDSNPADRVA